MHYYRCSHTKKYIHNFYLILKCDWASCVLQNLAKMLYKDGESEIGDKKLQRIEGVAPEQKPEAILKRMDGSPDFPNGIISPYIRYRAHWEWTHGPHSRLLIQNPQL